MSTESVDRLKEENDYDNELVDEFEDIENQKVSRYSLISYSVDKSIENLIKWIRNDKLIIPDFQRDFVWKYDQSVRFIETILLNLPVPSIMVYKVLENSREKFILVDGLQRVKTLEQFTGGTWKNESSKSRTFKINLKNSEWYGKTYETLSEEDKEHFEDYSFSTIMFENTTADEISRNNSMYDIFNRINTGSEKLTDQEVRNAIFQGDALNFLQEKSKETVFQKLVSIHKKYMKREKDLDFLLRLATYRNIYIQLKKNSKEISDDYHGEYENNVITTNKGIMMNSFLVMGNKGFVPYKSIVNDIILAIKKIEVILSYSAFMSVSRDFEDISDRIHETFSEGLVLAVIENDFTINISKKDFENKKINLWKSDLFYNVFRAKSTSIENVKARCKLISKWIEG